MHESTAYDMILDEGRVEGEIRLLLRQGRKRFGPPEPATESALEGDQRSGTARTNGRGCLDRQFLAGTAGHSLTINGQGTDLSVGQSGRFLACEVVLHQAMSHFSLNQMRRFLASMPML
jgi:hypothetical protein